MDGKLLVTQMDRNLLVSMQVRAVTAAMVFLGAGFYLGYTVSYSLLQQPQFLPAVCLMAVIAECAFAIVWRRKYWRLSQQPMLHKPKHPSFDPRHAFDRFVQSPLGQHKTSKWICIREMLSTWFGNVPLSEIRIGNICDLITYGFWYMDRDEYVAKTGEPPERLVDELMDAWDITFQPGYNPEISYMAHLWQPLRCFYRPLVFYLAMEGVALLSQTLLLAMGFHMGRVRSFTYYTYGVVPDGVSSVRTSSGRSGVQDRPAGLQRAQVPILFQHGVGVGVLPYVFYLARCACLGRPVAAMECPHLGMRWSEVADADAVVEALVDLLENKLGWSQTCVSGHSYGTFYVSRLLQLHPHLVDSICLIDPVTFNMFTGKLIRNFVYQVPDLMTWFVARDLHHAASVCRNFFWSCLCLWPDQLPKRSLVVLSQQDSLVPVKETLDMLHHEAPHAVVMHHPNHQHAHFIADPCWQDSVVIRLDNLLRSHDANDCVWKVQPQLKLTSDFITAPSQRTKDAVVVARTADRDRDSVKPIQHAVGSDESKRHIAAYHRTKPRPTSRSSSSSGSKVFAAAASRNTSPGHSSFPCGAIEPYSDRLRPRSSRRTDASHT